MQAYPSRQASRRGLPLKEVLSTLRRAPARNRRATISVCPSDAAWKSAVWPWTDRKLTSAERSMSVLASASWPDLQAVCNVAPLMSEELPARTIACNAAPLTSDELAARFIGILWKEARKLEERACLSCHAVCVEEVVFKEER